MSDFLSQYFSTTRIVSAAPIDLDPVGEDVMQYFREKGYTVSGNRLASGGWYISVHQGDWFRAILGLKTALNMRIEPADMAGAYRVSAGIGIFELQALPTVITLFVFTPVVLGQIWGIIQQQKLDEEAVNYIEDRIRFYSGAPSDSPARQAAERELGQTAF